MGASRPAGSTSTPNYGVSPWIRRICIWHISAASIRIARALLAAADVVSEGQLERLRDERYKGWSGELGQKITSGALNLASLADLAIEKGLDPAPRSGRQELAESLIARHCKY